MAVVQSAGQIQQLQRSGPIYSSPGGGVELYGDRFSDYAAIYSSQPAVRTVISFLARNVAQLGIHVFRRVSDTDRQRLSDHPLAQLLDQPNPVTTRYRMLDGLVHDLGIYDNAFWVKIRASGQLALVRIPPRHVQVYGDNWLFPEQYLITGNRGKLLVNADDMVHFRGYSPSDARQGSPPMETMRRVVAEEASAGDYRENMWRNGARMEHVITRPESAPVMSDVAKLRFWERWNAQYAGTMNSAKTALLEEGMDIKPMSFSARDSQYLEARKFNLEEVARFYHVPLPMVGVLDNANYSNMQEAHTQLYQDTLGPLLVMIEEEVQLQVLPEFTDRTGVYTEFNIAEKLKGSFEAQAAAMSTAVGRPWMTADEARARQNMPALGGDADSLVTPLNVLVGGQASPRDSAPPPKHDGVQLKARPTGPQVSKAAQVLQRFFDRQQQAVLSSLGAKKAAAGPDWWDTQRWDAELATDLLSVSLLIATGAARKALEAIGLDPDGYDEPRTVAWLTAHSSGVASGVNGRTFEALKTALDGADDPVAAAKDVFTGTVAGRVGQIADSFSSASAGFGTTEGVRQSGKPASKTWVVTSGKPRASHAAMDGETVDVGEAFSNGGRWPGDSQLSDDERAGCTCDLSMSVEA